MKRTPTEYLICQTCEELFDDGKYYISTLDYNNLQSTLEKVEKQKREILEALQKLLNKVNQVTAPWRHHEDVLHEHLDQLCERQIETEKVIEAISRATEEGK